MDINNNDESYLLEKKEGCGWMWTRVASEYHAMDAREK